MTRDNHVRLHLENRQSVKHGIDNPAMLENGSTEQVCTPEKNEKKVSESKEVLTRITVVKSPSSLEKPPLDDDYDPYLHRDVKHPTSYSDTFFHMLKASLGTGILAMPNAFHNAGFTVGTIGTLVIGFLCTYAIHSLIGAGYELCRRRKVPSMTYPQTSEAAFEEGPQWLRWFTPYAAFTTQLFLILYQIGASCIYVVFMASNIKAVCDEYYAETDVRLYMVYILIPLILICWIRNLKLLAPFSSAANFVTIVSFGITFYYIFSDIPHISQRQAVGKVENMPLFFGTVLFAMEAIGVILPLENEMGNPKRFASPFGVLNTSMIPITLLYTFVGFFGYMKFGEKAEGSITLNLPKDEVLAQSVKLMLAASIYMCYALSCYVAFDLMWNGWIAAKLEKNEHKTFWEYVTRTSIVLVTFTLAVAIPNLELFISLIGALCLATMGIAFPAIIQMLTFWDYYRGFSFVLFLTKNMILILIALLGFFIGTSTSLNKIYHEFFLS
ncbi:unnamed protein product [Bemisia tabaci]|uniref:Amino acid transporter transmembrane domain-containing protein n=1 Tax=Bemisia tabaci TaxID=7038 RepID=A0A9P0AE43_BEMTA|nr:unnamed protein product [Bemisia tabaci]